MKPKVYIKTPVVYVILIPILFLSFALRIYLLNDVVLDRDEAYIYSHILSQKSLGEIAVTEYDVGSHMLAQLLTKVSMELLGDTLFSLRWFSAILGFLSVVLIYKVGTWLSNRWVGLIAAFLLAISPYAITYAHSLRAYSSMIFYVLLVYYLAIRAVQTDDKRYWFAVALAMGAAVYNHQYSVLAWLGIVWLIFLYLRQENSKSLVRQMVIGTVASVTGVVVALTPIAFRILSNAPRGVEYESFGGKGNTIASSIYIVETPETPASFLTVLSWFSVVKFEWKDLNPNPTILYLLVGLIVVTVILAVKRRQLNGILLLLGWLLFPLLIYSVANWLLPTLWARPKHFGFTLPFFLLLIALSPIEIYHFLGSKYRVVGLLLSLIILTVIAAFWLPLTWEIYARSTAGNWTKAMTYLAPRLKPTDIVLCEAYEHSWNADYYNTDETRACIRNLSYWVKNRVDLVYPILSLGEVTDFNKNAPDPHILGRLNRVWVLVYDVPFDIQLPAINGQPLPESVQFDRTILLPPSQNSTVIQGIMNHLEYLATLPHSAETELMYHSRLAQISSLQGDTKRALEEWDKVQKLRLKVTGAEKYLLDIGQTLDTPPLFLKPAVAREAYLGDTIQFEGFTLKQEATVSPGDTLELIMFWRASQKLSVDYTVFIHIQDETGRTVFQEDFQPTLPTSAWWAGDSIWFNRNLSVPAETPPGRYKIYIGMYLLETLERLPVSGQNSYDNAIFLTAFQLQK